MSHKLEVISRYYNLPKSSKGSRTAKFILSVLCCNADDNNIAHLSLNMLSQQVDLTKQTVISKLKDLEKLGVVSINRKTSKNISNEINEYFISESLMKELIIKENGCLNDHILRVLNGEIVYEP